MDSMDTGHYSYFHRHTGHTRAETARKSLQQTAPVEWRHQSLANKTVCPMKPCKCSAIYCSKYTALNDTRLKHVEDCFRCVVVLDALGQTHPGIACPTPHSTHPPHSPQSWGCSQPLLPSHWLVGTNQSALISGWSSQHLGMETNKQVTKVCKQTQSQTNKNVMCIPCGDGR